MPTLQQPEAYLGGSAALLDDAGAFPAPEVRRYLEQYKEAFERWIERWIERFAHADNAATLR